MKSYQVSFLVQRYDTRNQQHVKNTANITNTWRLNNALLNNQCFTKEIKEIKTWKPKKKKENIWSIFYGLQQRQFFFFFFNISKAVIIGKFIGIQTYLRKQKKKSQINNETNKQKISNQQRNHIPKGIRKRITTLSQNRRKKNQRTQQK